MRKLTPQNTFSALHYEQKMKSRSLGAASKSRNKNSYFGVELGVCGFGAAGGVVVRCGAVTFAVGGEPAGFAAGGATPEITLYASITGLVMSTDCAAQSTGLCCDETSITTA